MNDHSGWVGSVEDAIAASLKDDGKPFVDLTRDDADAGPSCVKKEEDDGDEEPGSSNGPAAGSAAMAVISYFLKVFS